MYKLIHDINFPPTFLKMGKSLVASKRASRWANLLLKLLKLGYKLGKLTS